MADEAQTPPQSYDPDDGEIIADELQEAAVRRSPRYGVFLALGAGLGVFAAMILTFAYDGTQNPAPHGAVYSTGQVFGFLALVGIAVGLLLGGLLAIMLDRVMGRRTRMVIVDHETIHTTDA